MFLLSVRTWKKQILISNDRCFNNSIIVSLIYRILRDDFFNLDFFVVAFNLSLKIGLPLLDATLSYSKQTTFFYNICKKFYLKINHSALNQILSFTSRHFAVLECVAIGPNYL